MIVSNACTANSAASKRPSSTARSSSVIKSSIGLVALPMLAKLGTVGNRVLAEHPLVDAWSGQLIAVE